MNTEQYMSVEAPTDVAVVDFLSSDTCGGFAVTINRSGGVITITARQIEGGSCQEWVEHELSFPVVAPAGVNEDEAGEE